MRIIVTGGSGFIGYHLAEYLSRNPGHEVTVIDNHERGEPDSMFKALISKPNVIFLNQDMTRKDFYRELSGRYDCVYHLAAINGTKNFYERPYDVMRVNVLSLI
ncbi:MAG: NAD-dependent epimerase/dehydratase family protein [Synergistaceae bacterium]|nr:NAD-dependent epimerase/dehydratase family protein [Synergistaceae bacterium]